MARVRAPVRLAWGWSKTGPSLQVMLASRFSPKIDSNSAWRGRPGSWGFFFFDDWRRVWKDELGRSDWLARDRTWLEDESSAEVTEWADRTTERIKIGDCGRWRMDWWWSWPSFSDSGGWFGSYVHIEWGWGGCVGSRSAIELFWSRRGSGWQGVQLRRDELLSWSCCCACSDPQVGGMGWGGVGWDGVGWDVVLGVEVVVVSASSAWSKPVRLPQRQRR